MNINNTRDDKNSILRNIPQVEKLLQEEEISAYIPLLGHEVVKDLIRKVVDLFRKKILEGEDVPVEKLIPAIVKNCKKKKLYKLQQVINGTGVIIHTNLGRSPIEKKIFGSMSDALSGYCNLEFFLPAESRGKRGGYAEELICKLTSAEDALIVNNNASSVFLILHHFARGKEAIISRGQLIQIGGGFRIPDIMKQSGAKMVEVGTTNITELNDFEKAISDDTAMILSVHQSNYKIEGFSKSPSVKELSALKSSSIILARDLGSGNLVSDASLPQPFEPVIGFELSQGADLVCFSGDKLLGACQAGIIIGRKDLISGLRKSPLMRMIRVDKMTYYILQETLINYMNGNISDISLWKIILQGKKAVQNRVNKLMRLVKNESKKELLSRIPLMSTFGGGSMPSVEIESYGIQINIPGVSPDRMYTIFINQDIPIIGKIVEDKFTLDFAALFEKDIPYIAETINTVLETYTVKK